jgi:HEAT repeat protein
MSTPYRIIAAALTITTSVAVGIAQQPRIAATTMSSRPAGTPFVSSFRSVVGAQADIAWIGYAVPAVDGERVMCCFDNDTVWVNGSVVVSDGRGCCRACRLEPSADGTSMAMRAQPGAGTGTSVRLSGSDRMVVMFRVVAREIDRIRVFSEDCGLDAGGKPVVWLEDVRPADSVALLESLTAPGDRRTERSVESAISAIALHGDPAADASLERLVAANQPEPQRKKVTFWLGNARGARGLSVLKRLLAEDPSIEVRKSAVFGVSQSREAGAFDLLAQLARGDDAPRIRSEALFWLAQKDDARGAKIVLEALEKDPSAEVRKKAVFALSQFKDGSGIDALIRVARTGQDAATRSEAIFWLGQKAGQKVSAANVIGNLINERIDQDPDVEVKKKAVFALSQFPRGEGIPHLITLARTHPNREVRKQAMFWLAQSKDPRAIELFAEILK